MNQYKALMAGFAAVIGLGGVAAYNGAFSLPIPFAQELVQKPEQPVSVEIAKVNPSKSITPAAIEPAKTKNTEILTGESASPMQQAPAFDILRVESNGSVLVAGKAEKGALVEVLSGTDVLGAIKAQANGDFAIVIEDRLKPGDYQLVLRQTLPDGRSANSIETATVSVPDKPAGPVLALVETPGKPSRIITTPQAQILATAQITDPATPVAGQATAPADGSVQIEDISVKIEAVETEGNSVFVNGAAKGLASVRIYTNDVILGETKSLQGGRFVLQIQKEITPGDYIVRAEGLAGDGVTVLARAVVPFTRRSADNVAAFASPKASGNQDNVAAPQASAIDNKMAVTIRRGDTLWQISRRIYGRGIRYSTIYLANKDAIGNPNRIFPGQSVTIPEASLDGEEASTEEIKKRANGE
jgi:nucleoid-associated protein YgaU